MKLTRNIAAVAAALALTASSAQAQNILFTTTGTFGGTGCTEITSDMVSTACRINGNDLNATPEMNEANAITLKYTFGTQQDLDTFGNANFGFFTTTGLGQSTFNDILFSLTVNQTAPTMDSQDIAANINGVISARQGGLAWGPIDPAQFMIGNVNYRIFVDSRTNTVSIDPPGANGVTSSEQTIRGEVFTTVPEPGTYALMVAGLAGLAVTARRRNRTA